MGEKREADIQLEIRAELGNPRLYPDVVLWPNPCGQLIDRNGRHVRYGVANPGGSDLVGIFTTKKNLGIWIGAEIKSRIGKQREEQKLHQSLVTRRGGEYALLRSAADARTWIAELRKKHNQ